ncbi:DUF4189 domain-containing protein [Roseovarius salis]|uniref:DUF4189 domain-containing protein n=1 Tax=Roseovarius salis TaxID=3376063 RepID=UPI0037C63513
MTLNGARIPLASLLAFTAFMMAPDAATAAPKPCSPVVDAPRSGSTVPQDFPIRILPGDFSDCRIDEVRYAIVEIREGRANRTVHFHKADCCDFMQTGKPVLERRAPARKIEPGTYYVVQAQFVDRTLKVFGGLDHIRAELGPIAVVPVTTEKSDMRTRRHGDESTGPDAMVFALDMAGRFGHGRGASVAQARKTALDFCGAAACRIVSEPTRKTCHALAQRTRGGYWWGVGAGGTKATAEGNARRFCQQGHGGDCDVVYSYCK